jgi:hypothetical protein
MSWLRVLLAGAREATGSNFLHSQASVALDPDAAPGHRQHACAEISDTLTRLPTPGLIAQLINLAAPLIN